MNASGLRAFELRGPAAADALDWLHVHAEVAGAIEDDLAVTVWLRGGLPQLPFAGVAARELPTSDAEAPTGIEHDAPILVAEDLLVRPPWVARPPAFAGIELVVPRGNAFGSGEHASTRAALRALHATWRAPATLADVGTGSGILALYAHVRGCAGLQACDVDEYAVRAARALVPSASVRLGGPEVLAPADCVVANLTGEELLAAMPAVATRWTRRGPLVLAGMRGGEAEAVRALVRATCGDDVCVARTETIDAFTADVHAPAPERR
jgi:hypothetical protein